jgi:exodeoxyribonuclease VII large subunit
MNEPASNLPEYSVSDLAGALKRAIEDQFGFVRLRGEISGYRGPHSSGHVYFSLKDANARIDAVIWKGVFGRLRFRPEEGLEVIASGRISTFPGKSSYQIIIEAMEPAGVGALMALLEERRRMLTAEGLFAAERKQLLPYLPGVVGIVTSPTGAVIRDMIHRLSDRFPRRVLLWPVRVQGEGSAEEVAAAIRGFNAMEGSAGMPRPDVLIVARGGGSLEDLWSFNEEIVVRAAAQSAIPLVSAIGHETDWTLLYLVADVRAPTPTAAAEMVVPVRAELLATLADRHARLQRAAIRAGERRRRDLTSLLRALPTAEQLVAVPRQRLDLAGIKLANHTGRCLSQRRLALATQARRLGAQAPAARLATMRERLKALAARHRALPAPLLLRRRERVAQLEQRLKQGFAVGITLARRDAARKSQTLSNVSASLRRAFTRLMEKRRARLSAAQGLLAALGYRQVLARGYALVRDGAGKPLRSVGNVAAGALLTVELADGSFIAEAKEGSARLLNPLASQETPASPEKPVTSPRPARTVRNPGNQGSLF